MGFNMGFVVFIENMSCLNVPRNQLRNLSCVPMQCKAGCSVMGGPLHVSYAI